MTERPPRPPRAEPREIVELKQIKASQPELAAAVDMQIELVDAQRRVQARVPLPWIQVDPQWLAARQRAGRPAVRFEDIPLEWSDFRLSLRQTVDIMTRHELLDRRDCERILALGRDGDTLGPLVTAWYTASTEHGEPAAREQALGDAPPSADHVFALAIRPFLARCAEVLMQRGDLAAWRNGHCPVCGWEPDFAVITPAGERRLICGRCLAQWLFDPIACPYCGNDDRSAITSFATRDSRYRLAACNRCKRYVKAYDGRNAPRPVMVMVDAIATLPLDAIAQQRGYTG